MASLDSAPTWLGNSLQRLLEQLAGGDAETALARRRRHRATSGLQELVHLFVRQREKEFEHERGTSGPSRSGPGTGPSSPVPPVPPATWPERRRASSTRAFACAAWCSACFGSRSSSPTILSSAGVLAVQQIHRLLARGHHVPMALLQGLRNLHHEGLEGAALRDDRELALAQASPDSRAPLGGSRRSAPRAASSAGTAARPRISIFTGCSSRVSSSVWGCHCSRPFPCPEAACAAARDDRPGHQQRTHHRQRQHGRDPRGRASIVSGRPASRRIRRNSGDPEAAKAPAGTALRCSSTHASALMYPPASPQMLTTRSSQQCSRSARIALDTHHTAG